MTKRGKKRSAKRSGNVVAPEFPRYEATDFDDPDDFAVWAFAGLPHMKGAPLGMPIPLIRWISRRLWDCGFRHHPELRTIKYRPPHAGMGVAMLSAAGEWVPIDEPDPEPDPESPAVAAARQVLGQLAPGQRRQVVNALGLTPQETAGDDPLVPYRKADGSTVMVTPAQARRYARAKKARREAAS